MLGPVLGTGYRKGGLDLLPTQGESSLAGERDTWNPVILLRDERSGEGLGKPELRDLGCRGTRKGLPEERACDLGIEGCVRICQKRRSPF